MRKAKVLIIGGGIGGLTSAIALGRRGFEIEIIERDPNWAVYGVGIIQQSNVVRTMAQLGLLDDYLDAGFGFDVVEVFLPNGELMAKMPSPKLVAGKPANVGIARPALHKVLGERAKEAGAKVRLGVVATQVDDDGEAVNVRFSDGSEGRYDIVIGADGVYSTTRSMILPQAPGPQYTGQAVWRYNFERRDGIDCLQAYVGPVNAGLVPLSDTLMYMYLTTAEPGNPRYPVESLADAMRGKLAGGAPAIAKLAQEITVNSEVVYRPLEWVFVDGPWHKGRIVLLGDAVHATTPHLGQGAGMAIEDSVVLAEELDRADSPEQAFEAYRARRFERCKYIVDESLALCRSQLGQGPARDQAATTAAMFTVVAQPI